MKKTEKGWAILSKDHGLYYGWWPTKEDAIEGHTKHSSWEYCKKRGDKAVKIEITYES